MISTHDAIAAAVEAGGEAQKVIEQLLSDRQTMRECMADDIAMLHRVAAGEALLPDCVYVAGLHSKVLERIGK